MSRTPRRSGWVALLLLGTALAGTAGVSVAEGAGAAPAVVSDGLAEGSRSGPSMEGGGKYIGELVLHTPTELDQLLLQAEGALMGGYGSYSPVVLVLHGEEARIFTREAYGDHRELVDRAARLSAFKVIDIRICEVWMARNGIEKDDLPPFVSTVEYGPAEESRLKDLGYTYF